MSDAAQDRPVMFRAGRTEMPAAVPAAGTAPHFIDDVVLLADLSEFQPSLADAAYLAWSKAIVIRAAYGSQHDDKAWYGGQRRDLLHEGGVRFLGIYSYIVASQPIMDQVNALWRIVGPLRDGEKLIADIEEGSGSQGGRWNQLRNAVLDRWGVAPWLYSGLNFAAVRGLYPVDWVAAYGTSEPVVPHTLWQFTDAFPVPGVGTCDASVFHGSIGQLAALAYGGTQPAPAPAPGWTEIMISNLPTLGQGATGEDVRTLQGALAARHQAVTVDGSFGPATKTTLIAFQRSAGLAPDGICGKLTWAKALNR